MAVPREDELVAEARYHRSRYDLYKSRAYSSRPTTPARLRELESAADLADSRLAHARAAAESGL